MQIATLGGLIKDHRLKKRLSQLEVSLRIGWSDATRLSKIEQGRVSKPTRKTLDKIMDALELDVHQRGEMLRVGTGIPTKDESDIALVPLIDGIKNVDYPVLIVDTFWTTYYVNEQFIKVWKLSNEAVDYINENHPNWLELLFLTNYLNDIEVMAGYSKTRLHSFKKYQISQFKYEQLDYISETWFIKLIHVLSENKEFERLWNETQPMNRAEHLWYDYEFNQIMGSWDGKNMDLLFHVCTLRPTLDPRFNFIAHFPADEKTIEFCIN